MIKIATPVSHLFSDETIKDQIVRISDCLECRDRTIDDTSPNQEIFHCELQPIHKLSSLEFEYIESIRRRKPALKLITFHMAACCDRPALDRSIFKGGMYQIAGSIYSKQEMIENANKNFKIIKSILGGDVDIAVENNNYYPTDAYQYVTDPEFITEIVVTNNIKFLFDIAHAQVTAHNRNIALDYYINGLPLDNTVQLHICSPEIDVESDMAFDAHNYPDDEKLDLVRNLISMYSSIKYLTVEYYRDFENLSLSIKRLSQRLERSWEI